MENLEKKYRQDRLSRKELELLRQQVNSEERQKMEARLLDIWMNEDTENETAVSETEIARMKKAIDHRTERETKPLRRLGIAMKVAAAILIPVLLISTITLYRQNSRLNSKEIIVSTGGNERAHVTLPDGTNVSLNEESSIHYPAVAFSSGQRHIRFEGEGYFEVKKNPHMPFSIHTCHLEVEVVGTKFNLKARKDEQHAVVTLDEGNVRLTSVLSRQSLAMKPGNKVTLNYQTGNFSLETEPRKETPDWKKRQFVFRNSRLEHVVKVLEKNYAVTIEIAEPARSEDLFTGTITASNLHEALDIVATTYHLIIQYTPKKILLTNKKHQP